MGGQLTVGRGGRVVGGDAGQRQLLERGLTPGHAALVAHQPLVGIDLVAVDGQRREGRLVGDQAAIDLGCADARIERRQPTRHGAATGRIAMALDGNGPMAQLVDEADGGDLRSDARAIGVLVDEAFGQGQRSRGVEDDGVTIAREEALLESVAIAGGSGDAEVHRGHDTSGCTPGCAHRTASTPSSREPSWAR